MATPSTPGSEAAGPAPTGSLATHSLLRLTSQVLVAGLALATGAAAARRLGADGKGVLSTTSYLLVLVSTASGLGVGEAGVVLAGRRGASQERAITAGLTAALLASLVGAALLAAVYAALYHDRLGELSTGLLVTVAAVPLATVTQAAYPMLEGIRRFDLAAATRIGVALVTMLVTVALIMGYWTTGALVAAAVGWGVGAVAVLWALARSGIRLRPAWDRGYLRAALALGLPIQFSQLLVATGARLDIIPVGIFAGSRAVGFYSVALTVANVAAYLPASIVAASYPRLAAAAEQTAGVEIARLGRRCLLAATVAAVGIAVIAPFGIPLAFGGGFRPAIAMAFLLLPGTVAYAAQLAVGRAVAAYGDARILVLSFGSSLLFMLACDLALVPTFGARGAAVADSLSNLVGLAVAVLIARRRYDVRIGDLVPRADDLRAVIATPAALVRRGRPRP